MTKQMAVLALTTLMLLSAVGASSSADEVVKIALDWTPNTNHTGIVVAQELGYFAEEGLTVEIVQPGPTMSVHLVATGQCDFAVSMQEYVTMARSQDVPVVSVAAVFPHNTSGFASPSALGITSPADFEGLRYGGWGSDLEAIMIRTVMAAAAADDASVKRFNLGMLDFPTAVERDFADFFWIFYGWDGIHAQLRGIEFDYLPLRDLADVLDYYTPVIVTSETMIASSPDVVRRFLRALARGYVFAARAPAEAANMLLHFAPELDATLVRASQAWLADQADADLVSWGWQREDVWRAFADWAYENGLIVSPIASGAAFTNRFLPGWEGP